MTIESSIMRQTPYWLNFLFVGQMYSASHKYSIAATSSAYMESIVPSNKLIHLISRDLTVDAGGPLDVELYEAPTITDGTTPPTIYNLDRRSSKTPSWQLFVNPTGVSGGTKLLVAQISTGGGPKSTGGLSSGVAEFILKPSTKYVLKITNTGTQTSTVVLTYTWYESGN